jgi:hypothetical protein
MMRAGARRRGVSPWHEQSHDVLLKQLRSMVDRSVFFQTPGRSAALRDGYGFARMHGRLLSGRNDRCWPACASAVTRSQRRSSSRCRSLILVPMSQSRLFACQFFRERPQAGRSSRAAPTPVSTPSVASVATRARLRRAAGRELLSLARTAPGGHQPTSGLWRGLAGRLVGYDRGHYSAAHDFPSRGSLPGRSRRQRLELGQGCGVSVGSL